MLKNIYPEGKNELTLYGINFELIKILSAISECEESECEVPNELVVARDEKMKQMVQKIDNCYYFKTFLESQENLFKDEIDFLRGKLDKIDTMKTNFENYILNIAISNNGCIEGEKHKVKVSKRASVFIIDETKIPHEYIKEKIVKIPDKEAIKRDLKDLKEVEGTTLQYREHLRWD